MRILLGEAWRGIRSEPLATLLSVVVVGLALYIPSMLYLASEAGERYSRQIRAQVKLRAFLREDVDAPFSNLLSQVRSVPGVREVTFRDRDDLLTELEAELGPDLLTGLPGNPLPRAIDIRVHPDAATERGLDSLAVTVGLIPEIQEVAYGRAWAHTADRFFFEIQWFLGMVTVALAVLVLLIAANIIRLIIRTRREAIGIWLLLGASPLYARLPYYIEGAFTGLAGGFVTLGLLYGTQIWLSRYVTSFEFFTPAEAVIFILLALGVALLGSLQAARRQIVPL